jgi:hypothetical protein
MGSRAGSGTRADRGVIPGSLRRRLAAVMRTHIWPLALLTILPVLVNLPALSGVLKCDPELLFSSLGVGNGGALYPGGICFVDPTVAYITQPLGYLSAQDWLHGIIPWWNPYIGVGMPLAAEMQTQSFFLPFILLMHFHNGWLFQRIILQVLTAWFTYAFLIELGLARLAACLGAILFSLNGAFYLTPHAPIGPIFCLPMTFLGIERMSKAVITKARFGWVIFAVGLAYSAYGGFPEVTFFDDMLVLCWAIFKYFQMPRGSRLRFAKKFVVAGLVGLALTAPLSNAFIQYLQNGDVGGHIGGYIHDFHSAIEAPIQMFPFIYGAFASAPPPGMSDNALWIRIGGWFGSIPVLLGLYAFTSNERRPQKLFLLAWILVFECRYFGVPGFAELLNLVPGVAVTDILRFSPVSVMFPVFILSAFGFDHLYRRAVCESGRLPWVFGVYAGLCLLSLIPALPILFQWFSGYPKFLPLALGVLALMVLTNSFVIFSISSFRMVSVVATIVIIGTASTFLFSLAPALRHGKLDLTGVKFLQAHQDLSRNYTVGPFQPNYPAQYGISQINFQEIPDPEIWNEFVQKNLYPVDGVVGSGDGPTAGTQNFLRHGASFEAIGVKYFITPSGWSISQHTSAAPTPGSWSAYLQFLQNRSVGNVIPADFLGPASIASVSLSANMFHVPSSSPLRVQLCGSSGCATGEAALPSSANNMPLILTLNHSLKLERHESPNIQFSHLDQSGGGVWLPSGLSGGDYSLISMPDHSERLALNLSGNFPQMPRVYHDETMDIYQLPDPAPYASFYGSDCRLQIYSRQKFDSDCIKPATFIRRELYYPGWRAAVNGIAVPLTKGEEIFEQITVPAGHARIRFTYIPSYTPLACLLMIAAFLFVLAAGTEKFWSRVGLRSFENI